MTSMEKDVIKIASDMLKRIKKYSSYDETDERYKYVGSPKSIIMVFLLSLLYKN
jgi:hypothetical protein